MEGLWYLQSRDCWSFVSIEETNGNLPQSSAFQEATFLPFAPMQMTRLVLPSAHHPMMLPCLNPHATMNMNFWLSCVSSTSSCVILELCFVSALQLHIQHFADTVASALAWVECELGWCFSPAASIHLNVQLFIHLNMAFVLAVAMWQKPCSTLPTPLTWKAQWKAGFCSCSCSAAERAKGGISAGGLSLKGHLCISALG